MQESGSADRDVFVSTFNRFLAVIAWALDAFALVAYITVHDGLRNPWVLVPVALVAVAIWTGLWRPRVVIDDERIELRNVFRTITVPWPALIHVDTKYALTLYTPGHHYAAWAAPAPGRTGAAIAARKQDRGRAAMAPVSDDGKIRPGDLTASESGQVAYLVRDRWAKLREEGRIEAGVADETPVGSQVHWWWCGTMAVLLVGTVLVLVL